MGRNRCPSPSLRMLKSLVCIGSILAPFLLFHLRHRDANTLPDELNGDDRIFETFFFSITGSMKGNVNHNSCKTLLAGVGNHGTGTDAFVMNLLQRS